MKFSHIPTSVRALTALSGSVRAANDAHSEDGLFESVFDEWVQLVAPNYEPRLDLATLDAVEKVSGRVVARGKGGSVERQGDSLRLGWTGEGEGSIQITITATVVIVSWSAPCWSRIHDALMAGLVEFRSRLEVVVEG